MIKRILGYGRRQLKKGLRFVGHGFKWIGDAVRAPFDDRIRYNVYGWSSGSDEYVKNYRLLKYFPVDSDRFVYSFFKPQIQFFEPLADNRKLLEKNDGALKVFWTSECVHSPVVSTARRYEDNGVGYTDVSVGFDSIPDDHYVRVPYWYWIYFDRCSTRKEIAEKVVQFNTRQFAKSRFCSLIASHDKTGIRQRLLPLVSSVGSRHIDCPARFMHNDDSLLTQYKDSKEEYLKQFMFNLCPENDAYPGYVTEKIFDALWSGCVPLYHGGDINPEPQVISEDAYIFIDPEHPESALEKIQNLYDNPAELEKFLMHPRLKDDAADYIHAMRLRLQTLFAEAYRKHFGV